ncbi:hypothetical protein OBBRIDRAFT_824852 [Obba rivulosa]|uniref:Reverse transcriptase domain-containing protein n=1 Tax=Obba rivulosa TaxID=1052685 RepID=A0A8E2DN78_9APHY|nr:hypothetical protein OBBRIDRAFT_824852 [Obba rivulosa]
MDVGPIEIQIRSCDVLLRGLSSHEHKKQYKMPSSATSFIVCTRVRSKSDRNRHPSIPLSTTLQFGSLPRFDTKVPEKQDERRIAAVGADTVAVSIIQFSGKFQSGLSTVGWEMRLPRAQIEFSKDRRRIKFRSETSIGTWITTVKVRGIHWPSSNESSTHALFLVADPSYTSSFRPTPTVQKPLSAKRMRTTATLSLEHPPVPEVPTKERRNEAVKSTLRSHPHLFRIVTPIKVAPFMQHLRRHPNQAFVHSVCRALQRGFWPWADTRGGDYPDKWDETKGRRGPRVPAHAQFLRDQRDEEIKLGRFSETFGAKLLPGMYAMPIHVKPKPETGKYRMITNHSAGDYALNNMVEEDKIKDMTALDDILALFQALREFKRKYPKVRLVLWKSDVSQAYRRLPMAPEWQMKQVVKIDSQFHVDRCTCFGNKASMAVWQSFMCLVTWIAVNVKGIDHFNYVDDVFGFEEEGKVVRYEPYGATFPKKQVRLLRLWDELGVPHERKKQLYGRRLTILGIQIDPNAMIATLTPEGQDRLESGISEFCDPEFRHTGRTLLECQQLIGYINWAFQVFPLLKPALNTIFAKMEGLDKPNHRVDLDPRIMADFSWMLRHLRHLKGHKFGADEWMPTDLTPDDNTSQVAFVHAAFVHASPPAIGIYFPWMHLGYFCDLPAQFTERDIIFWNALAVCCAVHAAARRRVLQRIRRAGVFSDNTRVVEMFRSLRARPEHNPILKSGVDIIIAHDVDVRVGYVPEKENIVADAISRGRMDLARALDPELHIERLDPPRDALAQF